MISLKHISKRFGATVALNDVSLELNAGERLGLVGENGAGKSTLMNVLYGIHTPDQGRLEFDGKPISVKSPQVAMDLGVGMVHQHFTLVPTLTVAENVCLGREPTRHGLLDLKAARQRVNESCERLGFKLDPDAVVEQLTVGSQQKVEIIKALNPGLKTLILDEPTAVLTPQETDELFAMARRLSEEGVAVVLITHKLRDVMQFSTRIAVMRRGQKVSECTPEKTSADELAEQMIGSSVSLERAPTTASPAHHEPRLALKNVSATGLKDISLELHAGEILAVAGVDGNGQRELAEVITGLRPLSDGTLHIDARAFQHWNARLARELGIGHVPEDRLQRALALELSVEENIALGRHRKSPFATGPLIDFEARMTRALQLVQEHDVRPQDVTLKAQNLSGGNQQKMVLGRELDAKPKILVVVQPTRGLDIAAVQAVRTKLRQHAASGAAVLVISLDLEEVLALGDRIAVMFEGKLNGIFSRDNCDERELGRRMLACAG